MLTDARVREFRSIEAAVRRWAPDRPAVTAVVLVGSWARGQARMDSDVDVVVVVEPEEADHFGTDFGWTAAAAGRPTEPVRTGDWGALIEQRVRVASGLEIEFGVVRPSWTATTPVDPGTRRVITDGCRVWYDPQGMLRRLLAACGTTS